MALSIDVFKKVAAASQTHKEVAAVVEGGQGEGICDRLTDDEVAKLRRTYGCLDDELFHRILRVRKYHKTHVPHMLQALVDFRQQQNWNYRIRWEDLNPVVVTRGAHSVVSKREDDNNHIQRSHLPTIRIAYGKVDPTVASPKDFQQECQFVIEQASQQHPHGEIAVECDFRGTSFGVLRRLNRDDLQRGMDIYQTYPVKVKQVFIVNTTWPVRIVMKAVLALASKGIRKKVNFVVQQQQQQQ